MKAKGKGKKGQERKPLPHVFFDELKPLFDRLSDGKLLERYKDGYTQNQNESYNGMIWNHAPKHKFFSYRLIKAAALLLGISTKVPICMQPQCQEWESLQTDIV